MAQITPSLWVQIKGSGTLNLYAQYGETEWLARDARVSA